MIGAARYTCNFSETVVNQTLVAIDAPCIVSTDIRKEILIEKYLSSDNWSWIVSSFKVRRIQTGRNGDYSSTFGP
jgi:hypothetical protein